MKRPIIRTHYGCSNCGGKQTSSYIKAMIKAGFALNHLPCRNCGQQTITIKT